ncbi:restriction endonuclease [Aceticella autotrophica]|uniref:Restriction endonuclease n=1 Tax=Aceticella autotrophica TaxID=2755338 RepID=A0A975AW82_9THEO|nr:restriction endonuclease FokI C-terminal domain-containing protein [Aceticella autotrophica]QSZ27619.1 restriction endonuclease [Aceticella autotrophica]
MINYWWVTRPKRRLNSIPEILAAFSEISLDQEWHGQRNVHLTLEDALEDTGLKRKGERRDQTGGGARTYKAWLVSLGLIFIQESTHRIKLTLAGEAIMAGESPVEILKKQILRYQFPSSFSISRGVNVAPRFKIRPFRFMLRLLSDPAVESLSEEEIAKVVIVEAENETDACYKHVVEQLHKFRCNGDKSLSSDFFDKYSPGSGKVNPNHPFSHLLDIANTFINWIEYTQIAKRDEDDKRVRIIEDKQNEVSSILSDVPPFIDRPHQHEYFQRKYGLDLKRKKDTRNLTESKTITAEIIAEQKIKQAFISESLKSPIGKITSSLVETISLQTGIDEKLVEEVLLRLYPHGAIGSFMTEYFEMSFKGRDEATEFENVTAELFKIVFGFDAKHIGSIGLTPDVLLLSDVEGYAGIIDNKAYSKYTISNDHHNRMVHNYIRNIKNYYSGSYPLAFFSYIAGGFGRNINTQIRNIAKETSVHGSAMSVSNMIKLVEFHSRTPFSHKHLRDIFSVDRLILISDLE